MSQPEINGKNGNHKILEEKLKSEKELGNIEHQNIHNDIDNVEKDIKNIYEKIDDTKDQIRSVIDSKFKFTIILVAMVIAPVGSYSIAGLDAVATGLIAEIDENTLLIKEVQKQNIKSTDYLDNDIHILEERIRELEIKVVLLNHDD